VPFGAPSHGLTHRCLRFAGDLSIDHARLASGRWPSFTGQDSNLLDSRWKVSALLIYIASSFTRLAWRTMIGTCLAFDF